MDIAIQLLWLNNSDQAPVVQKVDDSSHYLSSGLDVANWGHGWQNLDNLSDLTVTKNVDEREALKRL